MAPEAAASDRWQRLLADMVARWQARTGRKPASDAEIIAILSGLKGNDEFWAAFGAWAGANGLGPAVERLRAKLPARALPGEAALADFLQALDLDQGQLTTILGEVKAQTARSDEQEQAIRDAFRKDQPAEVARALEDIIARNAAVTATDRIQQFLRAHQGGLVGLGLLLLAILLVLHGLGSGGSVSVHGVEYKGVTPA